MVVTHDPRVAAAADRVVTLRDGLVVDETTLARGRPVEPLLDLAGRRDRGARPALLRRPRDPRVVPALLMACLIVAGAATMTLAVQLHRVADDPWAADVPADTRCPRRSLVGTAADAARLAAAPGVAETTGPLATVVTTRGDYAIRDRRRGSRAGRGRAAAVTDGRWLRDDAEIVLERSYAHATGVGPGDRVAVPPADGTDLG